MKITGRTIRRSALGLLVFCMAALLLSVDRVDYQPYFRQQYYVETAARLHDGIKTNTSSRGELAAGFGRALLTPTLNAPQDDPAQGRFRMLPLAGYGSRKGRPAAGVHDDLYVKAVALRVADRVGVMVGADALIIPREVAELVTQRIEQELRLQRAQIYLSATHTHSSLGGWGEGVVGEAFAGGFQPGVRIWFADRVVTAVRIALTNLQPATFGRGSFQAPEFVRNRVIGRLGKVDPEFSYLLL